jgi:hypothetical protein
MNFKNMTDVTIIERNIKLYVYYHLKNSADQ